jgi:hypothetical protein
LWVGLWFFTFSGGCDGCGHRPHPGDAPMCGKCVQSVECRLGLECVNGVCETVPPSCHVQIGL